MAACLQILHAHVGTALKEVAYVSIEGVRKTSSELGL